ncbi:hypothetical protein, partial [Selenomonas ruminantium]|uniref:hypothetical protein n=1 Tax=Selenomonas ruminantium TaxID=971 RepID=UPI001C43348C
VRGEWGSNFSVFRCYVVTFVKHQFFHFAKRHLEKTLDNIVPGIATLLYVDWLPQCNGFAVSATI